MHTILHVPSLTLFFSPAYLALGTQYNFNRSMLPWKFEKDFAIKLYGPRISLVFHNLKETIHRFRLISPARNLLRCLGFGEMAETEVGPPRSFPIKSLSQLGDRSYFESAYFDYNKSSVQLLPKGGTSREKRPRLLACHDMKGGYLDDQWIQGSQNADAYTLTDWRLLDSFVYFSHNLVTLPPPSWTNAAHKHGVQVLGTFLTEWTDGAILCKEMFDSPESSRMYADCLAELADALGFDGWLINIENVIAPEQVGNLIEFVRHLTSRMHELVPESLVIWYDSVTTDGKLAWQDCLNEKNKAFFDVCDGIFTNYTWKESYPGLCASAAGERRYDVYMGVDVFGRNTFGGGGFHCDVALKAAREAGVSSALFAPGWTYEIHQDQARWWETIERCWPAARPDPVRLPFFTDFDIGRGIAKFMEGKQVSDLPWNNLSCQNLQPLLSVSDGTESKIAVSTRQECEVYSGGSCLKVVGDVGQDEICVVQLYHTEALIIETWLNVSYSVLAGAGSSFALALSTEDGEGSKFIHFLLDSEDSTDAHSRARSHHFAHISAVFEYANGHSFTTGRGIGDASAVSGGKWSVRDFTLDWGKHTLIDVFGICSAGKDLESLLIKLLHENELLFEGRSYVKQGSTQQSNLMRVERLKLEETRSGYSLLLGHIGIAGAGHEHCTTGNVELMGYHPAWLVADGGNKYLTVTLRWEHPEGESESATWAANASHLSVTVLSSDDEVYGVGTTPIYLGMTMLSSYYVYMLPLPKLARSVAFNLLVQCSCGKVFPCSNGSFSLSVPSHESGRFMRTQPTLGDWLFKEL